MLFYNEHGFAPFVVNFEGFWDTPFSDLEEELKGCIEETLILKEWDSISSIERRRRAALIDYTFDPAHERLAYQMLIQLLEDLDIEIAWASNSADHRMLVAGALRVRARVQAAVDGMGQNLMFLAKNFHVQIGQRVAALDVPLGSRQLTTLLSIIGVLCAELRYDASRHAKTAAIIKKLADDRQVNIGETTIEGYLKKVREAMSDRQP